MKSVFIIALALLATTAAVSYDAHGQTKRRRSRTARATKSQTVKQPSLPASLPAGTTTASGLTYLVTRQGDGKQPQAGETVIVHYTGALANGVKFDSSRDRGAPFAFKLGAGQVIKGWDEGIACLRVGDQAVLVIPPQLGYGERGAGQLIPPNSTLIFIVELVDVKSEALSDVLAPTLKEKGIEATVARYRELKSRGWGEIYTSESDLNGWGYRLLSQSRVKEAIEIFKLNAETYPNSANVYDSLAEAYLFGGDKQSAIENYKKALELDPASESARKALQALTGN